MEKLQIPCISGVQFLSLLFGHEFNTLCLLYMDSDFVIPLEPKDLWASRNNWGTFLIGFTSTLPAIPTCPLSSPRFLPRIATLRGVAALLQSTKLSPKEAVGLSRATWHRVTGQVLCQSATKALVLSTFLPMLQGQR